MVGLPDFRSHSKSGPFATQPLFNHIKSRLVWISDPHCNSQDMAIAMVPTIQKPILYIGIQDGSHFGWIRNGQAVPI